MARFLLVFLMPTRRQARHTRPHRQKREGLTVRTIRWSWYALIEFLRAVGKTPPGTRIGISLAILFIVALTINWGYHAFYKPTEFLFPVERALHKSPRETWQEYGVLFDVHSTSIITPELLAALAQAEGSGNPVARTYWRWRFTSSNPLEWYQPASSAVGMFQITNGTFQEAKRYCIHNHMVVEEGPWHDFNTCWFNGLYSRVLPGHAMELTAAFLDRQVVRLVGTRPVTLDQKHDLAAVIHLCGAGAGRDYVMRNYRLTLHQRCGDHDVRTYLTKIRLLKQQFIALKAR